MKQHCCIALAALILTTTPLLAAGPGSHWDYTGHQGPAHWGDIDKGYAECKLGKEQSPINIQGAVKTKMPDIQFDYKDSPLKVINNGHTVQVGFDKGSSIEVGGKRYDLLQTHFHAPSEELVNGKAYDMVWHLVHKSADGKLAVVGVLVKQGKPNEMIGRIAANLPKEQNQEHAVKHTVSAAALLPAKRGYYHFMGSLTTPPCSEGVSWYVLREPIEASAEQIKKFSALFGVNARPAQPLNARVVKESL